MGVRRESLKRLVKSDVFALALVTAAAVLSESLSFNVQNSMLNRERDIAMHSPCF